MQISWNIRNFGEILTREKSSIPTDPHRILFVHQYGRRGVKSISIRRIQIVL